ncbi:hypothetical protein LY76DRAFT_292285 [Colletotrichum caudatum]|nr:hypothetical protein LY76DRAFT_292285 [Colletotrichum caudatum]
MFLSRMKEAGHPLSSGGSHGEATAYITKPVCVSVCECVRRWQRHRSGRSPANTWLLRRECHPENNPPPPVKNTLPTTLIPDGCHPVFLCNSQRAMCAAWRLHDRLEARVVSRKTNRPKGVCLVPGACECVCVCVCASGISMLDAHPNSPDPLFSSSPLVFLSLSLFYGSVADHPQAIGSSTRGVKEHVQLICKK